MRHRGFTKSYQGKRVLEYPEMMLKPGKVYAVLGTNGSGKTTLARILAGTISPDKADVETWYGPVTIGYMPQRSYTFHMSVQQNVMLNGNGGAQRKERALQLMEQLELTCIKNQKGNALSGGETARVALARLLMRDYEVLLLDEPTASMDIRATLKTEMLLQAYQCRTGCTIVLITHMLKQARRMADDVIFLSEGCVTEMGPASRVLKRPTQEETQRFLEFYNL